MKSSNDDELERLFASARRAPQDEVEMPYGFAARVIGRVGEAQDDFFTLAAPLVRWCLVGSLAIVLLSAVFSYSASTANGPFPGSTERAVRYQLMNLALNP